MRHIYLTALAVSMVARGAGAQSLLSDARFVDEVVVAPTGQAGLTGMAWAPDASNRLFVARQTGQIRIVKDGVLQAQAFATIRPIHTDSECGAIGLAFDPNYNTNHFVYFFVTVSTSEQQIIRYRDDADIGVDKTTLIANLPTRGVNHDGGALGFGPDGRLYFSIGDLGNRTGVDRDLSTLAAKVARVDLDGSAPPTNPFFDGDGPNDDRIWALGFRNPFSFTFQPQTEELWVNVTGSQHEQIFSIDAGAHAGWGAVRENAQDGELRAPLISYPTGASAPRNLVTNGADRKAGVATFTFTPNYFYRPGTAITIAGVADSSFNGTGYVTASTADTVSITQSGPDAVSSSGTIDTQVLGNAVTGGTFWDASGLPPEYRGNFFFGDYGSGTLTRVQLSTTNEVMAVDPWLRAAPRRSIDLAVGPDGALYYMLFDGGVNRVKFVHEQQALVVAQLHARLPEGGQAAIGVRLARPPATEVQVQVQRVSGDLDIETSTPAFTFDSENWQTPQALLIEAAQDTDGIDDAAVLELSAPDLEAERVTVRVTDDDAAELPSDGIGGQAGAAQGGQAGTVSPAEEAGAGLGGQIAEAGAGHGGQPAEPANEGGDQSRAEAGQSGAGAAGQPEPTAGADEGCACRAGGHAPSSAPALLAALGAWSARRTLRRRQARATTRERARIRSA